MDFKSVSTIVPKSIIQKRIIGDVAIFTFENIERINVKNANRIKIKVLRSIVNPKIKNILIDLEGLEFIDTYGAQVLVTLRKFATRTQTKFVLKNVSPEFYEIIDLLKIKNDFQII
jgi:anti-anti-sigma factor